jgi:hypothetical protein
LPRCFPNRKALRSAGSLDHRTISGQLLVSIVRLRYYASG